ncbi:MAG: efflux RND transporter periplasmic adaptor subunit [Myxococcota bacterium]
MSRPLLLLPLVLLACSEKKSAEAAKKPLSVVVARPQRADLPIDLHYPAELIAIQQTEIQPMEIRGYLTHVYVDKGDPVKAGKVLATVDCTAYSDERAKLEEALRQNEARKQFAEKTLERLRPMSEGNFIGAQELGQAETEAASSAAALARAKAELDAVRHKVGWCELTAPFSGVVTMRYADPGALVGPGNTVLQLVDDSSMRVMVGLVERDIDRVKLGQKARLEVDAMPDKPFWGQVQRLSRAVDAKTRTMLAEIDIPNREGLLHAGMFGRVAITVDVHPAALLVPDSALLVQEDGSYVFTVDGKAAHRRKIRTGVDDGERVEILEGLGPTDQLVTIGQDLLGEGAEVEAHLGGAPSMAQASEGEPR